MLRNCDGCGVWTEDWEFIRPKFFGWLFKKTYCKDCIAAHNALIAQWKEEARLKQAAQSEKKK